MIHTVYRTTNLVNDKFYIGYHKTKNPSDSYLGSGTYIQRAVKKYGRVNFRKDILFTFPDAESALAKEKELVEQYRSDPLCVNLKEGGLNAKMPPHVGKAVAAANRKRVGWHHSSEVRKRIAESVRRTKTLNPPKGWNKGLHLSEETRWRIGQKAKRRRGRKNSNFGNRGTANPLFGTHRTQKTKDRIAAAQRERWMKLRKGGFYGRFREN